MERRGRPRHPDILTPREWEVLDLLREGLDNVQIADRLGISRDGVKYHVSQILSKLNVESREEAAAWKPEGAAGSWRWLFAPMALKAAGATVVAVAVVGTAVLGAMVIASDSDGPEASAVEPLVTYIYPEEGDVLGEPAQVIQICFEEPIDARDLPPYGEGDFVFNLHRPDGIRLGMRISLQPDGYGVMIRPAVTDAEVLGKWTLTFTVRDRETLEPVTNTVTYEVAEEGAPVITTPPQMCQA